MISTIFINFRKILSKSSLALAKCLRVSSNPVFKSKIPLGYPKILSIVSLTIAQILLTAKEDKILKAELTVKSKQTFNTSAFKLALDNFTNTREPYR